MIHLKHGYPIISGAEGYLARFSPAWLLAIMRDAARNTDCGATPMMDDIAVAVLTYLRLHHPRPVIRLEDIERMMRHALHSIGYPELAGVIRLSHPVRRVSLLHCTHNPPLRNEADFYGRLQTMIHECHLQGIQRLDISDLVACEELLWSINQAFSWHQPTGSREKIVTFVRRQIARLSWPHPLHCSIC